MQLRRRKPRALVASAMPVRTAEEAQKAKTTRQAWQSQALGYYDRVGEIRFSSQFYGRQLARVKFFPATLKPDGTVKRIEEGPPVDALSRIHDQGGRASRVQYDYGRLMFVTGEGCLFGSNLAEEGGEPNPDERWRFLWLDELYFDADGGPTKWRDFTGKVTDETGTSYRMWTPHPRHSDLADSPLRSVLDIAEELVILTASVRSTAVTRLTNGMFLLPSEASPPPDESIGKDEDIEQSTFLSQFVQHIQAQIESPGSAEARVPFLLEAAYEYLDQVRWLQMHDPATDYLERDLRIEAVKRLAIALDFPPEALLGMSDTNHWSAQQVQWDMWRSHGIPLAEQYANDINSAYLRPAMRDQEYADWENLIIGYDDSQVVVSPDQTTVADEAMDRAAISFEGYRKLKGIPEDMAPSEEEKKFVFGIKTRDPVVAGLEKEAPAVHGPQGAPAVGQNGKSLVPPQPTGGRTVSRQEAQIASGGIQYAARLAIRQCRTKAGSRLRTMSKAQNCSECDETIDGLPNAVVASAIGVEWLTSMSKRDPIQLVKGGTDDFRASLEEWGISPPNAEVLCERIEAYAAQTLFEPNTPDLPVGFASHVDHALEVRDHVSADLTPG